MFYSGFFDLIPVTSLVVGLGIGIALRFIHPG
jgi:hypothetical protein